MKLHVHFLNLSFWVRSTGCGSKTEPVSYDKPKNIRTSSVFDQFLQVFFMKVLIPNKICYYKMFCLKSISVTV